jgi:hypothetical protein
MRVEIHPGGFLGTRTHRHRGLDLIRRFDWWDIGFLISTWWPSIFILIGVSMLIGRGFRRGAGGLLFILFGGIFQLYELDLLDFDVWDYAWPIGLIPRPLLLSAGRPFEEREAFPRAAAKDIDIAAVFSGIKRRIDVPDFKGRGGDRRLRGADLDLLGAGLEGGKTTLEATAIFGGVTILVPRNWRVVVDGHDSGQLRGQARQPA